MRMASTIPAAFWRGGTSNGLVIHRSHLPSDQDEWKPLLSAAMGSPDPYGRQLNGMGGGISSLSKICVVEKSIRPDADVDYTFIQVGIKDDTLDMAGNCGNMSSAIGPFALDEDLLENSRIASALSLEDKQTYLTVRIFNTNTSKIIHSKFAARETTSRLLYQQNGNYKIDGVSGTASPIALSFLHPGGSKTGKVLPTSNAVDQLPLSDGTSIAASLIDIANPGVFIRASDVGVTLPTLPAAQSAVGDNSALMARLEEIRQVGASRIGLDPNTASVPKLLLLSEPETTSNADIRCLALSMGQCHKAIPLTLSLNLGVSCMLKGSLPWELRQLACERDGRSNEDAQFIKIAHPSGTIDVQADFLDGEVKSAILMRTARLLMKGDVNCGS